MNYEEAKMDVIYFEGDVFADDQIHASQTGGYNEIVDGSGLYGQ